MQTHYRNTLILSLLLLAGLLSGCGLLPLAEPALSTPEEVSSTPGTQVVEAPPVTEVTQASPATQAVEPAPANPQPAPNGVLRVVYIKDGEMWIWTEGKGIKTLPSVGDVLDAFLSDDGSLIAFTRRVDDFHSEIGVINSDGLGERLLVSVADVEAMVINRSADASGVSPHQLAWIPNTHELAFNTRQSFMVGFLLNDDLRRVNADTGELVTLLPSGQGGMFAYSPNGQRIAMTTPNSLFLVNADGSNRSQDLLSFEEVLTSSEYRFYPTPNWTEDSSALLVSIPPRDPLAARDQLTQIWRVPADGSAAVHLGGVPATFFGGGVFFSPDLSQLIYPREVGQPQDNLHELHLASSDLSSDKVLFSAPLLQFHGWAGDSQHYFFSSGNEMHTQLGNRDGNASSLMPDAGTYINIRPVGADRFLYTKDVQGTWEFGLADLNGQKQVIDQINGFPVSFDYDQ
jgi:hypothetical protein